MGFGFNSGNEEENELWFRGEETKRAKATEEELKEAKRKIIQQEAVIRTLNRELRLAHGTIELLEQEVSDLTYQIGYV